MKASTVELVRRPSARRVASGAFHRRHEHVAVGATHAPPARGQVWAPLFLRALALSVALLGLAGIGSVAARAPAAGAGAARALELSTFSVQGLGAVEAEVQGPPRQNPGPAASAAGTPALGAPPEEPTPRALGAPGLTPALETPCPTRTGVDAAVVAARAEAPAAGAPVVLNQATAAELQRLPGVGAKRAEAILALRQRLGRFRRAGDLLRVKGIGPRTLERLLPHVVLD